MCKTLVAVSGCLVVGQKAFATMKKPIPYSRIAKEAQRQTRSPKMADGEPLLDGEARYLPAFTRFDRNGDGNISEDELFDAMRDLGHQISE